MNKRLFLSPLWILTLAACLSAPPTTAETYFVTVDEFGFSPSVLNINAGDTVVWVNDDDLFAHTTTSDLTVLDPDYWNAILLDYLDSYAKTFNNPGTFAYRDQLDIGTGSIVVGGAVNEPPEVTITNPAPNAVFGAPASFTIEATAHDPDSHDIASVEFFVGFTSVGLSFAEPYAATVTDLPVGDHVLIAIASDGLGAQAGHSINITVKPAEILLSLPWQEAGFLLFDATGLAAGKSVVLLSSGDLNQWTPVRTNLAVSVTMTFTNALTPGPRFYRVMQLP